MMLIEIDERKSYWVHDSIQISKVQFQTVSIQAAAHWTISQQNYEIFLKITL